MSGKLVKQGVKQGKEVQHYCRPACVLVSVVGTSLEHLGPGVMIIHDESNKYRNGDVWECDECHLRWTLQWTGQVGSRYHIRILPDSTDWVPETKRQFKRRMKKKNKGV